MADYYIRTPDREESRGPFDITKLLTLAEAGQITENTLYYDETKEEWVPIALNEELKAEVFPVREKLQLNLGHKEQVVEAADQEETEDAASNLKINDMLAAAEADTDETRHLKKQQKSLEKAASISTNALGLMLFFSAISFIVPHFQIARGALESGDIGLIFNYPFILVGLFDLAMGILMLLAVTEIYAIVRVRAALILGFGAYVAWAIGDPLLIGVFAAAGLGIFIATVTESFMVRE